MEEALIKKLNKVTSYRKKGFEKLGLIIVFNEPPIPTTALKWIEVVKKAQSTSSEKFDIVFFLYRDAISYCKCDTYKVDYITLAEQVRDELSKYARFITEAMVIFGDFCSQRQNKSVIRGEILNLSSTVLLFDYLYVKFELLKAIPHEACAQDAPSDFLSDCIEISQAG